MRFLIVAIAVSLAASNFGAMAQPAGAPSKYSGLSRYQEKKAESNDNVVSIMVAGLTCTCARFAEDIRNVVNDIRPGGLRVLPVLGVGGFQNVNDLLFLRGIDMATVDQDNLKLLKKKDPRLYASLEQRVHFITKLYNAEFHVLARKDYKSLGELKGKNVNFNLLNSQTHVTADNVFNMLGIETVRSHYDNDEAITRLISGELAAMIVLTGAPQTAISKIKKDDGLHFIPIDEASLAGFNLGPVLDEYLPAELTSDLYPNLVPAGQTVPTLANRALLAVYNWPEGSDRYRRLEKFVPEFFGKISEFGGKSRHPKWKEINLAAEVPGWTRFKPAQKWLDSNVTAAATPVTPPASPGRGPAAAPAPPARNNALAANTPAVAPTPPATGPNEAQTVFNSILQNGSGTSDDKEMTTAEKEALFEQFRQLLETQSKARSAQ